MSIKGINLKNKTVVLSAEHYKGDEAARTFVCQEGFGCNPVTHGTAIVGYFVNDGEHCRIERALLAESEEDVKAYRQDLVAAERRLEEILALRE